MPTLVVAALLAVSPEEVARLANSEDGKQLALSVAICAEKEGERELLEQIREEKENSKIAGVVDLVALKRLQDKVVRVRRRIRLHRQYLSDLSRKELKCSHPDVTVITKCAVGSNSAECDRPMTSAMVQLAAQVQSEAEQAPREFWEK